VHFAEFPLQKKNAELGVFCRIKIAEIVQLCQSVEQVTSCHCTGPLCHESQI